MGYLKERYGLTLLESPPKGTCPECGVVHSPEDPHNRDSLYYQYKFYDQYGDWPTWADAMAHCPIHIKVLWTAELKAKGVDIGKVHMKPEKAKSAELEGSSL